MTLCADGRGHPRLCAVGMHGLSTLSADGSVIREPCLAVAIAAGTPGGGFVFACACFGTTGIRGVWAGANRDPSGGADRR